MLRKQPDARQEGGRMKKRLSTVSGLVQRDMGGRRQLPVSRPVRLLAHLGTTRHSRALSLLFGPGANPSASATRTNSSAPGTRNWSRRQLPGNPGRVGG